MKTPSDILDAQAFKSMAILKCEGILSIVHDWSFHREMLLLILHVVVTHRAVVKNQFSHWSFELLLIIVFQAG
jgi:hypothetical protein